MPVYYPIQVLALISEAVLRTGSFWCQNGSKLYSCIICGCFCEWQSTRCVFELKMDWRSKLHRRAKLQCSPRRSSRLQGRTAAFHWLSLDRRRGLMRFRVLVSAPRLSDSRPIAASVVRTNLSSYIPHPTSAFCNRLTYWKLFFVQRSICNYLVKALQKVLVRVHIFAKWFLLQYKVVA